MKKFLLTLAILLAGTAGCSGPGECDANMWIQVDNVYDEQVVVHLTTFAPLCDGEGLLDGPAEISAKPTGTDVVFPYLPAQAEAGHTVVFTVVNDGSLKDNSVTCTISQRGVDLTYARLFIDVAGGMNCTCGFEENLNPDLCV